MPTPLKYTFSAAILFCAMVASWIFLDLVVWVPDFSKLKDSVSVQILLSNGEKSTRLVGPKAPSWIPLSAMSEWVPRAVVSSEDSSFYSHNGIDTFEMQEALKKDWKEGRLARGASTITQQVLKNVYLIDQPKLWRKVKELAWASKLEAALSKPQILAFYLNMAEWGPGIYGIGEASRHYFSVSPAGLTARQSAFMAMLLPSPRRYHSFFRNKQLTQWAAKRVNRILEVMMKLGQLPEDQYEVAQAEQLWGTEVLPDGAAGAPADPGWGADEAPGQVFEPSLAKLPKSETKPVSTPVKPPEPSLQIEQPDTVAPDPIVVPPPED